MVKSTWYTSIRRSRLYRRGFALPTIVIASTVLFAVLVAAEATVASVSTALNNQYIESMASDAGESGLIYARSCLDKNNGVATWTSAKPLTSSTDCTGTVRSGCSTGCYVTNTGTMRTSFTVNAPTANANGGFYIISTGTVQLVRSSGTVWKTLSHQNTRTENFINAPQLAGGAGWQDNGHIGFYLSSDGLLFGFGDNSTNQLGPSSLGDYVTTPVQITLPTVSRVSKVRTSGQGGSIVCIITSDSDAYCRGKPGAGETGLMPEGEGWFKFVLPSGMQAQDIVIQGQGADSACVITTANQAYCAGDNSAFGGTNGVLGTTNSTDPVIPISAPKPFVLDAGLTIKSMTVRDRLTCAIASDNNAYCAGNDTNGTLGDGGSTNVSKPIKYPLPGGRKAQMVLGEYHNYSAYVMHVLATDGTIWGSGRNVSGELGDGTSGTTRRTPVQFGTRTDYISMISGPTFFCGVTSGGQLYCAGDNSLGQLGDGSCTNRTSPVRFALPAGQSASLDVNQFNMYQWNSVMVATQSGAVYGAGENTYGKLGNANTTNQCSPVKMQLPSGVAAQAISTLDADSIYVLGSNGVIYGTGRNNEGQLGDGTTTNRSKPSASVLPRLGTDY